MKCQGCLDIFDVWDTLFCECGCPYCEKCAPKCINDNYCIKCRVEDKKRVKYMWKGLTNTQKRILRNMILKNEVEI